MCGMSNLIKIELVYLGLFEIELIQIDPFMNRFFGMSISIEKKKKHTCHYINSQWQSFHII